MLDMDDTDDVPVWMQPERLAEMKRRLEKLEDPTTGKKLSVRVVHAAFERDERGLIEVLYLEGNGPKFVNGVEQPAGEPMTAYLKGLELAYLVEGW